MATAPTYVPPGTPAVTLPKYSAPVFTEAKVAFGNAVTSVVFEDVETDTPFTMGHAFKQGDIAPTDSITGRMVGVADMALQMDVKATHKDGSVRHAIISGYAPKAGEMFLIRAEGKVQIAHGVASKGVIVKIVHSGVEYTATTSNEGSAWLSGPVAREITGFKPLVASDGTQHPLITVQINERVYATGKAKFDVVVEHTKAYQAATDITYDIQIISDNTVVYSKLAQIHFPAARYKISVWQGGKPTLHIKHNIPYLILTKAVANYDQSVVVNEAALANYAKYLTQYQHGPMQSGRFALDFSAPGGRPDLGIAPDVHAATILSMDKRAKELMLASGDIGGSWGIHCRVDGEMLDITKYPYATTLGTPADSVNPATGKAEKLPVQVSSTKLKPDSAHHPAFAYVPYLLTGDYYYLEEHLFWTNYNAFFTNPYYRMFEKGWIKSGQLRGQGWSLRTLAEAEFITPDNHIQKPSFKYWMDCNMEYFRLNYTDAVPNGTKTIERRVVVVDPSLYNELGIITNGPTIAYNVNGTGNGISLFMDDFFTQGLGRAYELGNEEAGRLLRWKAKFQVGRLTAPGFCPNDAAMYSLRVRESNTLVLAADGVTKVNLPFYTTLKECRDNTLPADKLGCSPVFELGGYPLSTEGFPSNYQPALAACVDAGATDGLKAWNLFMSRTQKPPYGNSPQFAIVPRAVTEAVPPVVVTPPETVPPKPVEPPVTPPTPVEPPPVVVPPVEPPPVVVVPPTDPVTPPVEPPPVVVVPVEPDTKIVISNPCLVGLMDATVLSHDGARTKAYINQSSAGPDITITDKKFLVKGSKYTVIVLDDNGMQIAKIYPIQAV